MILSSHRVSSGDRTQAVRPARRHFYLLSHLTDTTEAFLYLVIFIDPSPHTYMNWKLESTYETKHSLFVLSVSESELLNVMILSSIHCYSRAGDIAQCSFYCLTPWSWCEFFLRFYLVICMHVTVMLSALMAIFRDITCCYNFKNTNSHKSFNLGWILKKMFNSSLYLAKTHSFPFVKLVGKLWRAHGHAFISTLFTLLLWIILVSD